MIIFHSVKFKNLLSYGNYWTEVKLDNGGKSLIHGKNGCGKSVLSDSICLALFNKPFRDVNKSSIVNSINGKDCLVELEFTTNNSRYKVVRGIKPNVFEIYQDGKLINQESSVKDYQLILEKSILKVNYKSFKQIVILGSASFTPFMQLSPTDRRLVVEDLLDINIFSTMSSVLKGKVTANKESLTKFKYELANLMQKKEFQEKQIELIKSTNEGQILDYENQIDLIEQDMKPLKNELEATKNALNELDDIIKELEPLLKKNEKRVLSRAKVKDKLNKISDDINFYECNDNCSVCKQDITIEFKENKIKELKAKYEEGSTILADINSAIVEISTKIEQLKDKEKSAIKVNNKIIEIESKLKEKMKNVRILKDKLDKIRTFGKNSTDDELKLVEINKDIETKETSLNETINKQAVYDIVVDFFKDNGIKSRIIKQYVPLINKFVNEYLSKLEFFVNFTLDESFKESIKSRHRDEFTYNNFSEGEKNKINLALLFSWRNVAKLKNSVNTNLLIMDEIIDSALDFNSIDNFFKLIEQVDNNISVFVISPKGEQFIEKFDDVYLLTKTNNFSNIEKIEGRI